MRRNGGERSDSEVESGDKKWAGDGKRNGYEENGGREKRRQELKDLGVIR